MQICTVLNSLSPSNNASKCSHKLGCGKISFAVLVPGDDHSDVDLCQAVVDRSISVDQMRGSLSNVLAGNFAFPFLNLGFCELADEDSDIRHRAQVGLLLDQDFGRLELHGLGLGVTKRFQIPQLLHPIVPIPLSQLAIGPG